MSSGHWKRQLYSVAFTKASIYLCTIYSHGVGICDRVLNRFRNLLITHQSMIGVLFLRDFTSCGRVDVEVDTHSTVDRRQCYLDFHSTQIHVKCDRNQLLSRGDIGIGLVGDPCWSHISWNHIHDWWYTYSHITRVFSQFKMDRNLQSI